MDSNDIEVKFSTKYLPFEYKWLEFRLIINKELYDEKAIDLKTYNLMQDSILARMTKIKNEYQKKLRKKESSDDLTNIINGGTMQST